MCNDGPINLRPTAVLTEAVIVKINSGKRPKKNTGVVVLSADCRWSLFLGQHIYDLTYRDLIKGKGNVVVLSIICDQ